MAVYWVLFFLPLFGVLFFRAMSNNADKFIWGVVFFIFTLVVGLRYQIGADWFSYSYHFELARADSLFEALSDGDPGYYFINWIFSHFGGSVYLVNLVCAAFLILGVVVFSRSQAMPWLCFLVAVPYVIIVVGMGYTRQASALGFLLLGLVALTKKRPRAFIVWALIAATFHKSAVLMLPVAALAATERRVWSVIWVGVIALAGAYFFVLDHIDRLWDNYITSENYDSQGGLIRVLMNVVPALLFLAFRNRLRLSEADRKLWSWMALFALLCVPLVLISSTATDRVALYLIPLQLFLFSRLHLIAQEPVLRSTIVLGVVFYYGAVQLVWLLFASHTNAWLPYQMVGFSS